MMELISVIVPVFNVENYISECLDSIVNQSYRNLEIVLVDDGSTDKSGKICDEYADKDKRIKVVHKIREGVSTARNTGLMNATGQFICWVDSDDYIAGNMVEYLYSLINRYQTKIAVCNYIRGTDRNHQFEKEDLGAFLKTGKEMLALLYQSGEKTFIVNASWGKLINRDLYEGIQYPEGKIFEDIYVTYKLINKCEQVVYSDAKLYYYFKREGSIMQSPFTKAKQDHLDALEERIQFFYDQDYQELAEKARLQFLHFLKWEFSRSKDILKDKKTTTQIIGKYRKYYKLGDRNESYRGDTRIDMFLFFAIPYLMDFAIKVKGKLF